MQAAIGPKLKSVACEYLKLVVLLTEGAVFLVSTVVALSNAVATLGLINALAVAAVEPSGAAVIFKNRTIKNIV